MLPNHIIAGLLAFALAFFPPLAFGQSSILGFPPGMFQNKAAMDAPVSVSYTGPGDVVSGALAFYSCGRAYNAAYATSNGNLCDLVASGNNAAVCTVKALSTGYANLASNCAGTSVSAACAAANGGSCNVSNMYDQSGALACGSSVACNAVQATLADQPALTVSALNGLPCMTMAGAASTGLQTANSLTSTTNFPFSITSVSKGNSGRVATQILISVNNNTVNSSYRSAASTVGTQSGTITATASDGSFHAIQVAEVSTGANASFIAVDGSQTTGTLSALTLASTIVLGATNTLTNNLNGTICEAGVWPSNFTSTYSSMNTNMHSATNGWNF